MRRSDRWRRRCGTHEDAAQNEPGVEVGGVEQVGHGQAELLLGQAQGGGGRDDGADAAHVEEAAVHVDAADEEEELDGRGVQQEEPGLEGDDEDADGVRGQQRHALQVPRIEGQRREREPAQSAG